MKRGHYGSAISSLERAAHIRSQAHLPIGRRAETQFTLAKALWDAPAEQGRDRVRAVEQVKNAINGFEQDLPNRQDELDQAKAWLAERES